MIKTLKEIINYKLIDTETIDITVGTITLLLIVLIGTSLLLKAIRIIVTRKLPKEDKNKFISFFNLFATQFLFLLLFLH